MENQFQRSTLLIVGNNLIHTFSAYDLHQGYLCEPVSFLDKILYFANPTHAFELLVLPSIAIAKQKGIENALVNIGKTSALMLHFR